VTKIYVRLTDIEPEISRIKKNLEKELAHDNKNIHPRDLLKGFVWKPLLISMTIMFFQQFTVYKFNILTAILSFYNKGRYYIVFE